MADGKVVIETDLDSSGIEKGLSRLGSITAKGLKVATATIAGTSTALAGIGNNVYEVKTKLDTGEYLQIDSRAGTVYRTRTNGLKVNEFDNRSTESGSIFEKIQPGYNLVSWDGSFGIDILIYKERSEPEWTG